VDAPRTRKGSHLHGSPPAPRERPPRDRIVLIADDDETTRIVLQRGLSQAGWLALPVDDGGEIWPILEREDVAALILDLNMPGVNGWEVLRRLRDDFRYKSRGVRVIVISGQADDESREFALRLGAAEFLSKPLDLTVVCAALRPVAGG
jgi:DNA-binding response OmpR family regulator